MITCNKGVINRLMYINVEYRRRIRLATNRVDRVGVTNDERYYDYPFL